MINVCYRCRERHEACHDKCEKYQAAKIIHDEELKQLQHDRYIQYLTDCAIHEGQRRRKRRRI